MNKHNKSLGKRSTNGPALSTGTRSNKNRNLVRTLATNFVSDRNGGLESMRERLLQLRNYLSDPGRKPSIEIEKFVHRAITQYETAVKASIGMPTYSDSVTLQSEAPRDIPTIPLDGYQLVQRVCYVPKSATLGAAAGGFYANLVASDLVPFVSAQKFFRIKKVTSWTVPRIDGGANQSSFAGVSVPAASGAEGTEVLPIWSENFTPVGQGFAGIVTRYPLGDFPQLSISDTTIICSHFTSLGNTGGITAVPVVFHVEIETLI